MARYVIQAGDTLTSIAQRSGQTIQQLLARNPGITNPDLISVGFSLRLGSNNTIDGIGAGRTDGGSGGGGTTTNKAPNTAETFGIDQAELDALNDEALQDGIRLGYLNPDGTVNLAYFEEGGPGAETGPIVPGSDGGGSSGTADPGGSATNEADTAATEAAAKEDRLNAFQAAQAAFPWITNLGLDSQLKDWIFDGYRGQALVGLIRQTDQWQTMFPNLRRADGTLRMNESTYLGTMDAYRRTLQRFLGSDALDYTNNELSSFLEAEIDANELGDRLTIYDQIVRGGNDIRNAFYVYAGISMSDDDLYKYVVDPITQKSFDAEYSAANDPSYGEFIARTTDVVTQDTGGTVTREEAADTVDILFHGGDPLSGDYLSLSELTNAFELAMLGSAATSQGLLLPSLQALQEIRTAGISRSQALQAYSQFSRDRNFINAIVSRSGGDEFTQEEFEQATFLGQADPSRELTRARQQEEANSRPAGSFSFGRQSGRLTQEGLSAFRS